jgi:lysophospholipase L1-like esterase
MPFQRPFRYLLLAIISANVLSLAACGQDEGKGGTATRPEPRDGGWMTLHKAFLERGKSGPAEVLFLGDSITQGWGNNDVWERYYGPRKAANFGIGGDRTQHVLWRLQNGEVDEIRPKVVVLMIGTNNLGSNTPDEIVEGITAIVQRLREKLPESKILVLGIFPRAEKPGPIRDQIQAINARIAKLDDGKTVKYLDIGPKFLEEDGTISKAVMPDFLHLSHKGYMIWADAIEPTLWSMLEEK